MSAVLLQFARIGRYEHGEWKYRYRLATPTDIDIERNEAVSSNVDKGLM